MKELFIDRIVLYFVIIVSAILVTLNVIRITHVPITYDEAVTYNTFVTKTYNKIINYETPLANNHILNTILTKFFVEQFNNDIFFLRVTNLLAQVIFLVFTFMIINIIFKNKWQVIGGFIFINMNPILLEFFGLCRGYGLSISLMSGSIFFLLRFLNSSRISHLLMCLLFSILSVYSNFTMLNNFLALEGIIVLQQLIYSKNTLKRFFFIEFTVLLCASLCVYLLVSGPIQKLQNLNGLWYGGEQGFLTDTVCSITKDYFFITANVSNANFVVHILTGSFVLITCYLLWNILKNKKTDNAFWVFYLLFSIPVLSTILQHFFIGTKFLISRTALFFIPLYCLLILSVVQTLKYRIGVTIILFGAFFTTVNLCINYNIYTSWCWQFDRFDLKVVNKMERSYHGTKIRVGATAYLFPSLRYYTATIKKNKFALADYILDVNKNDTTDDYYFMEKEMVYKMHDKYLVDTVFGNEFALMVKKIN